MDVHNAFLNGDLSKTVFMEQPPGFISATNPDYVCKLNKALYGLKQSPRAWYTKLNTYMLKCGFQGSKSDTLVFFSNKRSSIIILLIYVDDIIITGSHSVLVNSLINQLHNQFALKDLGSFFFFFGHSSYSCSIILASMSTQVHY